MLYAELFGDQAGNDIPLVARCRSDQQIRFINTRLRLHVVACAVAANAHHVVHIDDPRNEFRVFVDHDHIMMFGGKLFRERFSHFAQSYDDDPHTCLVLLRSLQMWGCTRTHLVLQYYSRDRRFFIVGLIITKYRRGAFAPHALRWFRKTFQIVYKHFRLAVLYYVINETIAAVWKKLLRRLQEISVVKRIL